MDHGTVALSIDQDAKLAVPTGGKHVDVEHNDTSISPQHSASSPIARKTYLQRMAFTTTSPGGWSLFLQHSYLPFVILFTFPAFMYSAVIYGSLLAWFSVVVSVYSSYFTLPPYNFSAQGVGLMNLAPFIGSVIGSAYGGLLSDWLIVFLSRRNNGIYEPEMRLWLALPAVLTTPGSILFFGLPTAQGLPWIIPAIGAGVFGFSFASLADIALTYAMDSYQEVKPSFPSASTATNSIIDYRRRLRCCLLRSQCLRYDCCVPLDQLDQWCWVERLVLDVRGACVSFKRHDNPDDDLGQTV